MTRQQIVDFLTDHYEDIQREVMTGNVLAQRVVDGLMEMVNGYLPHDQYHEIVERFAASATGEG